MNNGNGPNWSERLPDMLFRVVVLNTEGVLAGFPQQGLALMLVMREVLRVAARSVLCIAGEVGDGRCRTDVAADR